MKNLKKTTNRLVEFAAVYGGIDEDGQPIMVSPKVVQEVSAQHEETLLKKNKKTIKSLGVAWEGTDEKGRRVVMTETEAKAYSEKTLKPEPNDDEGKKEPVKTETNDKK